MKLAGMKVFFLLCYATCVAWAVHGLRSEAKAREERAEEEGNVRSVIPEERKDGDRKRKNRNETIYAGMLCLFNLILCLGLAWFASVGS